MCGFFGMINGDAGAARRMTRLTHRGPDSSGEYAADGVYMKHFRLAILGAEAVAHQPMSSFDGTVVVAFNGEIYNFLEIAEWMGRKELAADGDTRVLVEFLAVHGLSRLAMLNGMFAIAAYFPGQNKLCLLRDRFGVKPLYYVRKGGGMYFGSEIKCFRDVASLVPNQDHVKDYLDAGSYPSGEQTFFSDVRQVEGGTWVEFQEGTIRAERYYDLRAACRALMEEHLDVEQYEELLADSMRLRLRSDVPISLHYSGGTDSTALLLKTKEVWGWDYPLVAFTMAFREKERDESRLAESYCRRVGVENFKVYLAAAEVPALAEELHRYQDEPYGGVPTIAYFKMNRIEREMKYIVSIEGQGGDETFGGYLYHLYMCIYDLHRTGRYSGLLQQLLRKHKIELSEAVARAEGLIAAGFRSHTDLTDLRAGHAEPARMEIDWLRSIQLYDILVNKIPRTMRFNDRASMACGREIRFPLLDYRVLAYGLAFDHRVKFARGLNKGPLRAIIKRHLPGVYTAPKRSVVTPQTEWLHGELKDWALSRIAVLRRAGMVPERCFACCDEFFRQRTSSNSFYVWQLINLSFFCN